MTSAVLPQPQGLSFTDWAALLCEAFAELGLAQPPDETAWSSWACSLLYFPELATLPSPIGFNSWREWADRVIEGSIEV